MTAATDQVTSPASFQTTTRRWRFHSSIESLEGDSVWLLPLPSVSGTPPSREHVIPPWLQFLPTVTTPAPANVFDVVHEIQGFTTTSWPLLLPPSVADEEGELVAEVVTPAEIADLQRMWALPYPGDVGFDFRVPD